MTKLLLFISKNSRLLFFSWLIFILIASSIPQLSTPKIKTSAGTTFRLDYFIHFLEFFVLSVLFMLGWVNNRRKKSFFILIFFILIGSMGAFCVELFQWIIPGRAFNLKDCYYNLVGLAAGILFLGVVYPKKNRVSIQGKK